jgi:hypothetical protein
MWYRVPLVWLMRLVLGSEYFLMSGDGILASRITELGKKFLRRTGMTNPRDAV